MPHNRCPPVLARPWRWPSSIFLDAVTIPFIRARIPVSALVTAEAANVCDEVESLLAAGWSSIKIKVARRPVSEDVTTIWRLREQIAGRAMIRLDANRLWSLNDAITFCRQIGPEGIAYVEEPLSDTTSYPAFHRRTDMPVALDETLVQLGIEGGREMAGGLGLYPETVPPRRPGLDRRVHCRCLEKGRHPCHQLGL